MKKLILFLVLLVSVFAIQSCETEDTTQTDELHGIDPKDVVPPGDKP